MFADADFAGLFLVEDNHDHASIKSRIGVVTNLGGVPIYWSSKL